MKEKLFSKTYAAPTRREAPEMTETEVVVHPGDIATEHDIRPKDSVVQPLRAVSDEEQQLAAEVAAKTAKLEAARAAAVEIQDEFDDMLASRDNLRELVAKGESELAVSTARAAELDGRILDLWLHGGNTAEEQSELQRRQFMVTRMPAWVGERKSELQEVETKLAEFAKAHGVTVPE